MSDHNGTAAHTLQTLPVVIRDARGEGGSALGDAGGSAQMRGAGGARRGLRGGAAVLQAARGAYLQAQWSGPADRRLVLGSVAMMRV